MGDSLYCANCDARFVPQSQLDRVIADRISATDKLDAACIAAGCAPEELAEKVAEMRRALEDIGDATRDGLRVVTEQRDAAHDAARKMAYLLHRMNDDGHKRRAEEIDQILRDGGVE